MTTVAYKEFVGGLTLPPMGQHGQRGPPARAPGILAAAPRGKPWVELTWNEVVDEVLIPHLQEGRTARFTLLQSPMDVKGLRGALAATCTAPI